MGKFSTNHQFFFYSPLAFSGAAVKDVLVVLSTLFVFIASMSEIFNFQFSFFVFAFFFFAGSYHCCISSGLL